MWIWLKHAIDKTRSLNEDSLDTAKEQLHQAYSFDNTEEAFTKFLDVIKTPENIKKVIAKLEESTTKSWWELKEDFGHIATIQIAQALIAEAWYYKPFNEWLSAFDWMYGGGWSFTRQNNLKILEQIDADTTLEASNIPWVWRDLPWPLMSKDLMILITRLYGADGDQANFSVSTHETKGTPVSPWPSVERTEPLIQGYNKVSQETYKILPQEQLTIFSEIYNSLSNGEKWFRLYDNKVFLIAKDDENITSFGFPVLSYVWVENNISRYSNWNNIIQLPTWDTWDWIHSSQIDKWLLTLTWSYSFDDERKQFDTTVILWKDWIIYTDMIDAEDWQLQESIFELTDDNKIRVKSKYISKNTPVPSPNTNDPEEMTPWDIRRMEISQATTYNELFAVLDKLDESEREFIDTIDTSSFSGEWAEKLVRLLIDHMWDMWNLWKLSINSELPYNLAQKLYISMNAAGRELSRAAFSSIPYTYNPWKPFLFSEWFIWVQELWYSSLYWQQTPEQSIAVYNQLSEENTLSKDFPFLDNLNEEQAKILSTTIPLAINAIDEENKYKWWGWALWRYKVYDFIETEGRLTYNDVWSLIQYLGSSEKDTLIANKYEREALKIAWFDAKTFQQFMTIITWISPS